MKITILCISALILFGAGFFTGMKKSEAESYQWLNNSNHIRAANGITEVVISLQMLQEQKYDELVESLEFLVSHKVSFFNDYSDYSYGEVDEITVKAMNNVLEYNENYGDKINLTINSMTEEKVKELAEGKLIND